MLKINVTTTTRGVTVTCWKVLPTPSSNSLLPDVERVSNGRLRLAGIRRVQGQHKEHRDLLGQEN